MESKEECKGIEGEEIKKAIDRLKREKTPGPDGITNEDLKALPAETIEILKLLFNKILSEENIPEQWKCATITLIHKKGNRDEMKNYRPIGLISTIYKLFTTIIKERITGTLNENQPPEQAGFRSGYSTTDHLQTVNQIIEKCSEYNKPIHLAFIDYSKAFDSLEHPQMIEALGKQDIPRKYIRLMEEI